MIVGCLSFDFRRVRLLEFQCRGTSVVIVASVAEVSLMEHAGFIGPVASVLAFVDEI